MNETNLIFIKEDKLNLDTLVEHNPKHIAYIQDIYTMFIIDVRTGKLHSICAEELVSYISQKENK